MDKFFTLIDHGLTFVLGFIQFITDHPATFIVGIVGAGTISFLTQYTKYAIKLYTRISRSHWFLLLTALFTTAGSIVTYLATNVSAEDVKFSSWLTAMFTAVTLVYPLIKIITNFLAAYQLVRKPLEDQLKEIAKTAEDQDTTAIISTTDEGKDSVVTQIEPAVKDKKVADF